MKLLILILSSLSFTLTACNQSADPKLPSNTEEHPSSETTANPDVETQHADQPAN